MVSCRSGTTTDDSPHHVEAEADRGCYEYIAIVNAPRDKVTAAKVPFPCGGVGAIELGSRCGVIGVVGGDDGVV